MRFSIIIPLHNSDTFDRRSMVKELLNSIPDRTDLEVIIVDDHSPRPIVLDDPFHRTRLRVVQNRSEWRYAGTARNRGIEVSTGDALIFADSDDLFVRDALGRMLDHLSGRGDPWDLAIFPISSFDHERPGSISIRHSLHARILERYRETRDRNELVRFHVPYGRVVKKDLIERHHIRYDDTRVGNDIMFGVLVGIHAEGVIIVDETAYRVRTHSSSLIGDLSPGADMIRLRIYARVNLALRKSGLQRRFTNKDYLARRWNRDRVGTIRLFLRSLTIPGTSVFRRNRLLIALRPHGGQDVPDTEFQTPNVRTQ